MEEIPTLPAFRIEVQNPEGMFNLLSIQEGKFLLRLDDNTGETQLSSTKLDGGLIDHEETSVSLLKTPGGAEVHLGTLMKIANPEQHSQDKGYFTEAQIKKTKDILEQEGLTINIQDAGGINSLYILLENGVVLAVDLGFKSRGHKSARYSEVAQIEHLGKDIAKQATREAETDFANEEVSLGLFRNEGEGEEPGYFILEALDADQFRNIMRAYAKGYEQIMKALHEAKGKSLPDKPIVLAP